jgi:hypothetical protein
VGSNPTGGTARLTLPSIASVRARRKHTVGWSADEQAPDPQRVVPDDHDAVESEVLLDLREDFDEPRQQDVVQQQPHADGRSGSRRSRTVSAA